MTDSKVILVADPADAPWEKGKLGLKNGVSLVQCDGAFDALDELVKNGADALITSSQLKDMSGYHLCAFIKTSLGLMSLPVGLIQNEDDEAFWQTAAMADELIDSSSIDRDGKELVDLVDRLVSLSNDMGWSAENATGYFESEVSSANVLDSYEPFVNDLLTARLVTGVVRMLSVAAVGKKEFLESFFRLMDVLAPQDAVGIAINGVNPWCALKIEDKISKTKAEALKEDITKELVFSGDIDFEVFREGKRRGTRSVENTEILPLYSTEGLMGALIIGTCERKGFNNAQLKFYEGLGADLATIYSLLISRERIVALEKKAAFSASADSLTGLYNLEFLLGFLQQQLLFSFRQRLPVGLAIVDVDGLAEINQNYGTDVGDFVLTSIAAMILKITRSSDLVARYSGDEFAVVLPNTDGDGAKVLAEKLRSTIESDSFSPDGEQKGPKVTVSIGCAMFNMEDLNAETILRDSKVALQKAKDAGKNQVCLDSDLG